MNGKNLLHTPSLPLVARGRCALASLRCARPRLTRG